MMFLVYDTDGRVLRTGGCPPDHLEQQAGPGETAVEIQTMVSADDVYWAAGIQTKTALSATFDKVSITADGVDEAVLSNLPNPCTVYVDNTPYVVTDTSFEFSTSDAGVYWVLVNEPEYVRQGWRITAS